MDLTSDSSNGVAVPLDDGEPILVEEILLESEEKYRLLVENCHEAILVTQDGVLKFANGLASELTGYSREELIGVPFVQFIYPGDQRTVVERHHHRIAGDSLSPRYPFRIVRKDGAVLWGEIDSVPIRWEGQPAVLSFIADITARRELERELVLRSRMLDHVTDAVIVHNQHGRFLYVNEAACRLHGYSREELMALSLSHLLPPDDATRMPERIREIEIRGEQIFEVEHCRKDGTRIPIEIHASVEEIEGTPLFFSIERDIHQRKEMERIVQKARNDLLFAVSHEMKTPLMNIAAAREMLSILPEEERQRLSPEYDETLERNLRRLRRLIDNLLDSQRSHPAGLHLVRAPCDLGQVVRRIIEEEAVFAASRKVRLVEHLTAVPMLDLDEEAIERMLENLIINAIKFSSPKGQVEISLAHTEKEAVLSVTDHGCGIPVAEQNALFQPFKRAAEGEKGGPPGTGLGLYVAKTLVEAHGGTILLKSTPGAGTTVTVRLLLSI